MNTFFKIDFPCTAFQPVKKLAGWPYWTGCSFFMLLSIALFLVNTRQGIGVLPDSVRYMRLGYEPFDAPLYPWLLDFTLLIGSTIETGAKAVGLIFACANTALIWHILARTTGNWIYCFVGTAIIVLSPQFVGLHSMALSEPPFLFFLLCTLLAVSLYLETESSTWLIVSAVVLGLAALVRFTAPPLGAAIAVALLFDARRSLPSRFKDILILGLVSASIFLFWSLVSQLAAHHSIGRELSFLGNMGARQWLRSLESLAQWLLPKQVPLVWRAMTFSVIALMSGLLAVAYIKGIFGRIGQTNVTPLIVIILGSYFFFYIAFVLLSTMIEANLSITPRYAFPAYVTTALMMTIVLAGGAGAKGNLRVIHHGLVATFVVVLAGHIVRTAVKSQEAFQSGIGFASVAWANSPTIRDLRQLPTDAMIYSNAPDVINFLLRRKANLLPQHVKPRTGLDDPFDPYVLQMQSLRQNIAKGNSYIVFFDKVDWRFYLVTEAELLQSIPLSSFKIELDGRIYVTAKPIEKV